MKYPKGFGIISVIVSLGILIAVAVVGVVIQKRNMDERDQEAAKQVSTVAETTIGVQPSPTQKAMTASEATDVKLDTDISTIDASLNAIATDATGIDAGLNDQMGDLSE